MQCSIADRIVGDYLHYGALTTYQINPFECRTIYSMHVLKGNGR